ncbi:hypothetical protein Ahy_A02g006687 isoform B [Arachis hypogaea]|uniref:NADP-dependent oxidoreductase domain-containing protein n=1 Tax=Arachis hypogaea TaxID=3818 RepID=A0A445EB02_ARAHY|nr:hypothetical protein Ahy_A02g006687 isoform B [Arachis hypogaea]
MAAVVSHHHHHTLFFTTTCSKSSNRTTRRSSRANSVRCCSVTTTDNQSVKLSNGNDSLHICRVLNGMWQTSGGWGRIDRDDAVNAMLRYADAGLSTFDMADHFSNKS